MNNMISERKKGTILSYVVMVINLLASLLFTPFVIRTFGQAEYGLYHLVNAITSYLYLFDLGVGNAIIRYMSKYRVHNDMKKQEELMAVTIAFYCLMGVLIMIVGLFIRSNFDVIFKKGLTEQETSRGMAMLTITMINAAITIMLVPFSKTILAFEKFTFSKTLEIIKTPLRTAILIVALKLGGRGITLVSVNLFLTIVFGLVTVFYTLAALKVRPRFGKIDIAFVKEIFSYSLIVFIQMLATQINAMVDQLLIGSMVASSAVILGVYAVGAQMLPHFETLSSSVTGILMPGIVKMVETTNRVEVIEKEMIRIGRMLFMLLGIVYMLYLMFGHDFMILWAGQDNEQSYYVAAIILLPMTIVYSQIMGSQILWALNRHKIQAILQICVAFINILLTAIMIKWNPLFGASIATAISYFIGSICIQNFVYKKYIGISMARFYKGIFKGILPCILISAVFGILIKFLNLNGWIGFLINCAVMLVAYIAAMYCFGCNDYEKKTIAALLLRYKGENMTDKQ